MSREEERRGLIDRICGHRDAQKARCQVVMRLSTSALNELLRHGNIPEVSTRELAGKLMFHELLAAARKLGVERADTLPADAGGPKESCDVN